MSCRSATGGQWATTSPWTLQERWNKIRNELKNRINYWTKKETGKYSVIKWWKHQLIMTTHPVAMGGGKGGSNFTSNFIAEKYSGNINQKVYRSSKWWEVKDWGESVSELMIERKKKNNYKKLYTVLSYLGVFTFCTCCILICLVCTVASFKLSCVQLLLDGRVYCCSCLVCIVILCVFAVLCVHCCFLL